MLAIVKGLLVFFTNGGKIEKARTSEGIGEGGERVLEEKSKNSCGREQGTALV